MKEILDTVQIVLQGVSVVANVVLIVLLARSMRRSKKEENSQK
ncbi:MAG: hypothetical protein ACLUUJ_07320 [Acutalibacteraceae bacterium]